MLSGNNGVLQRATDAKTNTDNAQIKERIQLAYHSALTGGQGSYTKESLEEELEKEFGANNYTVDDSDNTNWILSAKGQSVTIPSGKEDTSKIAIKVGTTNIKGVSDLTTLYGETTDYSSVDGVQWQLFYDDDSYIYLIAKDYVPGNTLPDELLTDGQMTTYCRKFANTTDNVNYVGTIMGNTPWSNGTESSTITGNAQTSKYLKWVNCSIVSTKNNPNMKAVAFMMDTSKWSNFAGEATGATALGGPTVEMFALSYNAKHSTNELGTYGTIIDESTDSTNGNANSYGYKVKIGTGSWSNFISGLDATNTDEYGNMWIRKNEDACGYWLASPSSDNVVNLREVGFMYSISSLGNAGVASQNVGFRPLVSIPKSSLK